MINKLLLYSKRIFTGLALVLLIAIITLVSMWEVEVGFGVLTEQSFWINYAVSCSVGFLGQMIFAGVALDLARTKNKVESIENAVMLKSNEILNDQQYKEFESYIEEKNELRLDMKRKTKLNQMLLSVIPYYRNKAQDITLELKSGNVEVLEKIKVKFKKYTVKQVIAIGLNCKDNDDITGNVNWAMTSRAGWSMLSKLPIIALLSIFLFTDTTWSWDNATMWLIRLFTLFIGVYSSFVNAEDIIKSIQMPVLQTRLGILKGFKYDKVNTIEEKATN